MNAADLLLRGFTPTKAPGAYTHCRRCRAYRWFSWWTAPSCGVTVATCEHCKTVPAQDVPRVRMYPLLAERRLAVNE